MALEACNDAIGAAVGRELTDREKKIVLARAIELKAKIDRAANDPLAIDNVLKSFADEVEANAALQKRTTALNWRAFSAVKAWRKAVDFVVKNPGEGVKAFFRGSLRNFQGAQDSLANLVWREKNARTEGFVADLIKENQFSYAFSGADDKNIMRAWAAIKDGKVPDPKFGKNAIVVAQLMDKHLEGLRVDQNQSGAFIARQADRLFRRSHDPNKIAKAGGNDFGSDAAKGAWVDFVHKRMDWTRAFDGEYDGLSDAAKRNVLGDVWEDFSAANHYTPGEPHPPTGLGSRNIGKKLSHSRQLIFNKPDDELAYFQTFGHGNSIAENVFHNLAGGGRDIALMRKLGPNALDTLQKVHDDWAVDLKGRGPKARADFEKAWADEMGNTWRLITGEAGHPNDNFVSRFFATVRQTTNLAATGQALFSLPNDLALRASQVARMTGTSFGKALADAAYHQATGYGLSAAEKAQWFAEMGLRTESAHLPVDPFLADHAGFGAVAKFNKAVSPLGGHSWWDNRARSNNLVADGYRHWTLRDTAFDKLTDDQQATFAKFGIAKDSWNVLRQAQGTKIDDNMRAWSPSEIRSMDLQKFKSLTGTDKPSESQLARARNQLADNYRNLMGELADRSVSAPSIAGQAFMGLGREGMKAGTFQGELYRGALQLKGWAANYMRNHLGAELYGRDTEMMSFGQKMASVLRGNENKAVMGMAKLIAAGVPIASVTYMLKDLASGKTPENPLSQDALLRAFARQGLGLYTDFLLQDSRPDTTFFEKLGRMTGPEFGLLSDIANESSRIGSQIKSSEGLTSQKLGADERSWLLTAGHNIPGTRLFWTKFAVDYFVINNLAEMMNPGYQQRLIQSAAKKGQTYLPAPGPQTTP